MNDIIIFVQWMYSTLLCSVLLFVCSSSIHTHRYVFSKFTSCFLLFYQIRVWEDICIFDLHRVSRKTRWIRIWVILNELTVQKSSQMNIGSQQQVLIQYKFHFVFLLCLRFDIWEFFKTILLFNFVSSHFALFVCIEKYLKTWIKYKILR